MYEEAAKEFEKALYEKGDDPDIHYNIAILYDDHLHVHKKAVEHYKKYLELAPESQDTAAVRGWLQEAEKYIR